MSLKYKLSAALLTVVATSAMATTADAFQARSRFCEDSFFWTCGSAPDPQITNRTVRHVPGRTPTYTANTDTRLDAMSNAGGGGGGGAGGGGR